MRPPPGPPPRQAQGSRRCVRLLLATRSPGLGFSSSPRSPSPGLLGPRSAGLAPHRSRPVLTALRRTPPPAIAVTIRLPLWVSRPVLALSQPYASPATLGYAGPWPRKGAHAAGSDRRPAKAGGRGLGGGEGRFLSWGRREPRTGRASGGEKPYASPVTVGYVGSPRRT